MDHQILTNLIVVLHYLIIYVSCIYITLCHILFSEKEQTPVSNYSSERKTEPVV